MIKLTRGDILKADAEALVNTVNSVGVMGRGIALQFKKAFPDNFKAYKNACDKKQLRTGKMLVYNLNRFENPKYIINFPTKNHWRGKSRIEDIQAGLESLVKEVRKHDIQSIAVPPLGCGLGGLNWKQVMPMIKDAFNNIPDVEVLVYEPAGAPDAEKMVKQKKTPNMTVGRAALLSLMKRYLEAIMDPFVSLLEIHKLMYFMQEAGEPLRLNYTRGVYGPYAKNLRHVLNEIEGYFVTGFADAEDRPDLQIELIPEATNKAERFLKNHYNTFERFNRVSDLIEGFETPFGMELLSTVHWVAENEGGNTPDKAIKKTYSWSDRKKMFKPEHIQIALKILKDKNWINT